MALVKITKVVTMVFEDDWNNSATKANLTETGTDILSNALSKYVQECKAFAKENPERKTQERLISFNVT